MISSCFMQAGLLGTPHERAGRGRGHRKGPKKKKTLHPGNGPCCQAKIMLPSQRCQVVLNHCSKRCPVCRTAELPRCMAFQDIYGV